MKRNLLFKSMVISTALSSILIGCGSTTGALPSDNSGTQTSISGKAVDGYLQNAVVCLDLNNDGQCQAASEPMTTTLEDGSFELNITQEVRDNENYATAMLLIFGGVDVDTGRDFKGKLLAPNDGSEVLNVSPITTLVAKHLQKSIAQDNNLTKEEIQAKIQEARQKVADTLEISEEEVGLDPVAQTDDKLIRKALKIQKSIEALLIAEGVSDADIKQAIEDLYTSLAESLDGEAGLDKLFEKASAHAKFQALLRDRSAEEMLAIADQISKNLDSAFDDIDGEDRLEKIAAVTEDDFEQIKTATESGDDMQSVISGIVYVPDHQRDWLKKFIENDLKAIGIEPTTELINKLKAVYDNEIRAGVLFKKAERLKENADAQLQEVYAAILAYKAGQAAQNDDTSENDNNTTTTVDLVALLGGKNLFVPNENFISSYQFDDTLTSVTIDNLGAVSLRLEEDRLIMGDLVLTYYDETESAYEFTTASGEILKFFKDINAAESYSNGN